MSKMKPEELLAAIESLGKYMKVAPKPRGPRQERMRQVVTDGLEMLAVFAQLGEAENGMYLFQHLLGVALGSGAITETQCSRIMLSLVDEAEPTKKARH